MFNENPLLASGFENIISIYLLSVQGFSLSMKWQE